MLKEGHLLRFNQLKWDVDFFKRKIPKSRSLSKRIREVSRQIGLFTKKKTKNGQQAKPGVGTSVLW